jgi:phage-related protein
MPENWITPFMLASQVGLKTIRVTVMIDGTRSQIWDKGSRFVAALLAPCEVELNEFPGRYFKCAVKNASHVESCLRRWHKATVELDGYEYGAEQTETSTGVALVIDNDGDIVTPCNVSVTPGSSIQRLTLYGLARDPFTGQSEDIVLRSLSQNVTRVIDSEKGTITEGTASKFDLCDLMEFPTLKPGSNVIGISSPGMSTTVTYRPYYL